MSLASRSVYPLAQTEEMAFEAFQKTRSLQDSGGIYYYD